MPDANLQQDLDELRRWIVSKARVLCRQGYIQRSKRKHRLRWREKGDDGVRLRSRWLATPEETDLARHLLGKLQADYKRARDAYRALCERQRHERRALEARVKEFAAQHLRPDLGPGHRKRCMRLIRTAAGVAGGLETLAAEKPWDHPPRTGRPRKPVLGDRWLEVRQ